MRSFAYLSLLMAGVFSPPIAAAHEYWLAPSAYSVPVGQTLAVQAYVGSDFKGELRPFATTRTVRLEVQDKVRKDVKSQAINGDLDLTHLTVEDEGGIVVAFETNFVPVELPPEKFDDYLRKEGLEGPLKAREALGTAAGPGRERYLRCAKTWIAGSDGVRLQKPFGMPLEIIPRSDPRVSGKLTLQVLYNAQPTRWLATPFSPLFRRGPARTVSRYCNSTVPANGCSAPCTCSRVRTSRRRTGKAAGLR
jgi:uncharacterized GH25 family protein